MDANKTLYLVKSDSDLVELRPAAPGSEAELQLLIANYPRLIGVGESEQMLLVKREQSVPGEEEGGGRWSIDHLFVTQDAVPVLVEVKRATDTRIRREVVGQMLDYAANGVAYWRPGELEASFRQRMGADAEAILVDFLGDKLDGFWTRVDDNLRAGRIRMLFVADSIPPELARIVEFMNEQMRADVHAVELNYYAGPGGSRLLGPRLIGETERTKAEKSGARPSLEPIGVSQWLQKHIEPRGPDVMAGASILLDFMRSEFGEVSVASTQGSLYVALKTPHGNTYPFFVTKAGTGWIGFAYLNGSPSLSEEGARKSFYDRFNAAIGPLSTPFNPAGTPSFKLERLADPQRRSAFLDVAGEFAVACRKMDGT